MDRKYRTILADPPWPYSSSKAIIGNGGRGHYRLNKDRLPQDLDFYYPTMSLEEIKAIPVEEMAKKNSHLYLWTTNSFMVEAHEVARAWGFKPKTILTWVKTTHDGSFRPSMSTGTWYRSSTEHCLFCVRGKLRLLGPTAPTSYLLPRLPHSVKPGRFYRLIEEQSPGPYLELFARKPRANWDRWGNALKNTVEME